MDAADLALIASIALGDIISMEELAALVIHLAIDALEGLQTNVFLVAAAITTTQT
jgi:hypothetical protein